MEFTTQSVIQNYNLLFHNSNYTQKSQANKYLTLFKKAPNFLLVALEIFSSTDINLKLFISLALYNHIKENLDQIISTEAIFNHYKSLILSQVFPHLSLSSDEDIKISSYVCSAISILIIAGSLKYWSSSLANVLEMSTVSNEHCIYAAMMIGNIHLELDELKIAERDKKQFMGVLTAFGTELTKYITMNLNVIKAKSIPYWRILYKCTLDVILSASFGLVNILQTDTIAVDILSSMVEYPKERALITEVLSHAITYADSATITEKRGLKDKNNFMNEMISACNIKEMKNLYDIITLIYNLYTTYSSKTTLSSDEEDLLFNTASIFQNIPNCFPILFFYKGNNLDQILRKIVLFFLSYPKLKISSLFLQSVIKLKEFMVEYFKYIPLSPEERTVFLEYLYQISDAIMNNCKLKSLVVNYEEIKKNIDTSNEKDLAAILDLCNDNENIDLEDTSIGQYRKNAEEPFNDLFLAIYDAYQVPGAETYLKRLGEKLVTNANCTDKKYLLLVEVVLFNVRCIKMNFELPNFEVDKKMLLNFSNFILSSQLISNEKIMVSFIAFLSSIHMYVYEDKLLYKNSILFLIKIASSVEILNIVSLTTIINIMNQSNDYDIDIYKALFDLYYATFDKSNYIIVELIVEAILIDVCKGKPNSNVIQNVMNDIRKPLSNIINNKDKQSTLKVICIWSIFSKIIGHYNLDYFFELFNNDDMKFIFPYSNSVIEIWYEDSDVMNVLILFYSRFCVSMKNKNDIFFDIINSFIFTLYAKNTTLYDLIYLMKTLYGEILSVDNSKNKPLIESKFFVVCDQIVNNVTKTITNMESGLSAFSAFFATIIQKINHFDFTEENLRLLHKMIDILIQSNNSYCIEKLNLYIVKSFLNFLSNENIPINLRKQYTEPIMENIYKRMEIVQIKSVKLYSELLRIIFIIDREAFSKVLKQDQFYQLIIAYFNIHSNIMLNQEKLNGFTRDLIMAKKHKEKEIKMKVYEIKKGEYNATHHMELK